MDTRPINYRFVISGCSGGGKSTLLAALAQRGYRVFAEPGREVVKAQLAIGGNGLPWEDGLKFAELCVALGRQHYDAAHDATAPVFFDRSVVDNISGIERAKIPLTSHFRAALAHCCYAQKVFMVPPWPEIYRQDEERRHGFHEAELEYHGLLAAYQALGYQTIVIPKQTVAERANFVEAAIHDGDELGTSPIHPHHVPPEQCANDHGDHR